MIEAGNTVFVRFVGKILTKKLLWLEKVWKKIVRKKNYGFVQFVARLKNIKYKPIAATKAIIPKLTFV